jgi:hypothetical protein
MAGAGEARATDVAAVTGTLHVIESTAADGNDVTVSLGGLGDAVNNFTGLPATLYGGPGG